jgi:putative nucleotidyltransferase with HDIG domain
MILRDGDRVTPEQEMKLAGLSSAKSLTSKIFSAIGVLGQVLVLLYFPYRFARKNIRKFRPSNKDLVLLALLTSGHFLLLRTLNSISATLGGAFPSIATDDYIFLFPFAATAIMVRIFINSEVALVYAAICAPLAGLIYGSLPVVVYSMLGSIIGAHGVRHCENRGIIFTAGIKVSVVNLALTLSFILFNGTFFSVQTIYAAIFAVASGVITSVLVTGAIPLIESIFQYTTDIKLLELTNLNSPVLRELMVRAPGTYHHSVVVGNLVEAAAEAINANPLLARVAAYYHDIGKTSKAQYFIENQSGGENKHDKLSPSMSALILISHVKEGAELARINRLGQPVADIIRQSHGTALIKFFFQKAQEQAVGDQVVDEHEFRYPGPKPQTREAGLVLLADCVEAASRTLTDPTPARIQGLVQKIINNIFIDGQLDECELTLKNLHEIAWSFNKILTGIYHQRIDYPQPAFKEKTTGGKKQGEHSDNEPAKALETVDKGVEAGRSEDIKRLGMSH